MTAAITIAAVCCALLVLTVLIKPNIAVGRVHIPLYPIVAAAGAILAVAITPLTFAECGKGIVGAGAVNPIKILTLFISVTIISVFLDEAGLFEALACKALKHAGKSGVKLFVILYLTVAVLTVFTSNDVIILTFTPFIIYFCKSAGISPTPYLVAEFTAANTFSMALIIGNPTNVYLATSAGIDFVEYLKVMAVPALLTGLAAFGALFLLFRKTLKMPLKTAVEQTAVVDKPQCIVGVIVLFTCTVGLAVSGYIGVEMWIECAACAAVLIVCAALVCLFRHKKPVILGHAMLRVPYAMIPFVLSMFIISLSLDVTGATKVFASALSSHELILYGVSSFFCSNLMNNIPMSVIFSSMINVGGAGMPAVYAAVIGSNLGALLTPVGALAGIMFSSITKKHGVKFSALTFMKYGAAISLAAVPTALGALALMLL